MLRRRLPVILLVAASIVLGLAIAGPPNQDKVPLITSPGSVSVPINTAAPTTTTP